MSISPPDSGGSVDAANVTSMHEAMRTLINAVPTASLGRHSLGPQHMPSAILAHLSVDVTSAETLDYPVGGTGPDKVAHETVADAANWKILSSYTLTKVGGWVLPPCKVLFMFNANIAEMTLSDNDNMVWLIPEIMSGPVGGSAASTISLDWLRIHHDVEQVVNKDADSDATLAPNDAEEPYSFFGVLDKTGEAGTWKLESIRLRGAIARGNASSAHSVDPEVTINRGFAGFIAFYKD